MEPFLIMCLWAIGGLTLFMAALLVTGYIYDRINPGERLWLDDEHNAWFLGNGWIEDKHGTIFTDLDAYYRARDVRHPGHTDQ